MKTKGLPVTSLELQKVLGAELLKILNDDLTPEERAALNEKAKVVINYSNQFINNSNFILNGEKHLAEMDALDKSVIKEIIGEFEDAEDEV